MKTVLPKLLGKTKGGLALTLTMLLMLSFSFRANAQEYCEAGSQYDYSWISNVAVGDINNSSQYSDGGYGDYTGMSTEMEPGMTYTIEILGGNLYGGEEAAVWVDWNQDFGFSPDEKYVASGTGNDGDPFTAEITVPDGATEGPTRLRIRTVYYENLLPCGIWYGGEVEDYTVEVAGPEAPTLTDIEAGIEELTLYWEPIGGQTRTGFYGEVQGNAADPVWTIYVAGAMIGDEDMVAGDELGLFDGDLLVGAFTLTQVCTPDNQFENVIVGWSTLNSGDGYTPGNPVSYHAYDDSEGNEITEFDVNYLNPYGDAWTENQFPEGDGAYSIVELSFTGAYVPTFNIYYADGTLVEGGVEGNEYTDTGLTGGEEYCYYVTQIMESGEESEPSNVLCGTPEAPPVGTLEGYVYDADTEEPIEGAEVWIEGLGMSAITDAEGFYSIPDIDPGTYDVSASAEGYEPSTETGVEIIGGEVTSLDFFLTPVQQGCEHIVELYDTYGDGWNGGTLTVEVNGTVVLDEITLESGSGPETFIFYANTGDIVDFIYTAGSWASENYYYVYGPFGDIVFEDGLDGEVPTGGQITANCEPPQYGTIAGTVTDAETTDPIEGATVTVEGPGLSATTGPDGTYTITDVEVGTYDVTAEADGYNSYTESGVEVLAGETTTVDFALEAIVAPTLISAEPGIESVILTWEPIGGQTRTGYYGEVQGNAADPVWTIYVAGALIGNEDMVAGDELGLFDGDLLVGAFTLTQVCTPDNQFENVIVGWSTLNSGDGYTPGNPVSYHAYDDSEGNEITEFDVNYLNPYGDAWTENQFPEGDGEYSIVELTFEGGVYVPTFNVYYEDGTLVEGGVEGNTYTDTGLNPDEEYCYYVTQIMENGEESDPSNIECATPLPPANGAISGTVTDAETTDPIEGATVSVEGTSLSATTGPDGTYTIEEVEPGTYDVTADADGYFAFTETGVEVLSGETTTVDFALEPFPAAFELPFEEMWDSGDFATNLWMPGCENWNVDQSNGNPEPSAEFDWSPSIDNYDCSLISHNLNGTNYDVIMFNYDIYLDTYNMETIEEMYVEVLSGEEWITIAQYDNQNDDFDWTSESFDISQYVAGSEFKVRFRATGEDSFNINWWRIDNIYIGEPQVTTGTIAGTVTDAETSDPIEGATVSVEGTSLSATTGPDGTYTIEEVDPGTYEVTAEADDYESMTQSGIEVIGGETTTVDFELQPTGVAPVLLEANAGIEEVTLVWEPIGGQTRTGYFGEVQGNPADPVWTIYLAGVTLNGDDMQPGDEVAIFDGDLMVGAYTLDQVCTPDNQFENDLVAWSTLASGDGYTPGNPVTYKAYSEVFGQEVAEFEATYNDPYGDAWTEPVFPEGDGEYSLIELAFTGGYVPTFNIYYDDGTLVEGGVEGTTYTDTDLEAGVEYCYYVTQIMENGEESDPSNTECAIPEAAMYTVTTSANPSEGGTTTGDGEYEGGTEVTVTATANPNWEFINWTEDGTEVSTDPEYTFIIESDRDLVANFQEVTTAPVITNIEAGIEEITIYWEPIGGNSRTGYWEVSGNPADPVWTLYLAGVTLNGEDMVSGDEVGVFDGDLIVGAFTLTQVCTPDNQFDNDLVAWSTLNNGDGYVPGNPVTFKAYDDSEGLEVGDFEATYNDPYGDAWTDPFFPEGDGEYSLVELAFSGGYVPTFNVYYEDGTLIEGGVEGNQYTDTGLTPGEEYCYYVTQIMENGEESDPSNTECAIPEAPPFGALEGYVTDANTTDPIEGAEVVVEGTSYSATTNDEGYYMIEDVEPDTYDVTASADGYLAYTETGVEVIAGETVTVDFALSPVPPAFELPFVENWDSGDFETNLWMPGCDNWNVDENNGNPEPSAEFHYSPSVTNYECSLVSHDLDGTANDVIMLNYDIYLNTYNTETVEEMYVEVLSGGEWVTVAQYDNQNDDFDWTSESFDVSEYVAGSEFKVRFRATGEDSWNINDWRIDNIYVGAPQVEEITTTAGTVEEACVGEEVMLPINVEGFEGVYSVSLALDFDPAVMEYVDFANPHPALDGGTLLVNAEEGTIYISWYNLEPADIGSGKLLDLVVAGVEAGETDLVWDAGVSVYGDENGEPLDAVWNDGYANFVNCNMITGYTMYYNADFTAMPNTTVYLRDLGGNVIMETVSDEMGYYEFLSVEPGSYYIDAMTDIPWGGVNSIDAYRIAQHFTQIAPLEGLYLAAADVTADLYINTIDALATQQRFVQQINSFPAGDWLFNNDVNGGGVEIEGDESITYDIYGLSYGDVNGSYIPTATKSGNGMQLDVDGSKPIGEGETFELPIRVEQSLSTNAVSLALNVPSSVNIEDVAIAGDGNLNYNYSNGELRIAWFSLNSLDLNAGDDLLTLTLTANNLNSDIELGLNSDVSVIGNNAAEVIRDVKLSHPKMTEGEFALRDVYPNPVKGEATVEYVLPEDGKVSLRVYDVYGKLVRNVVEATMTTGIHTVKLDAATLEDGVYFYSIEVQGESKDYSATKRMVVAH